MDRKYSIVIIVFVTLLTLSSALRNCTTDLQCPEIRCTCVEEVCVDFTQLQSDLGQCPKCDTATSSTDCNGNICANGICQPCLNEILQKNVNVCSDNPISLPNSAATTSPPTSPVMQKCQTNDDCKVFGCTCFQSPKICVDLTHAQSEIAACSKCETNAHCESGHTCDESLEVCDSCSQRAVRKSVEKCVSDFASPPAETSSSTISDSITSSTPGVWTCTTNKDCTGSQCSCFEGTCVNARLADSEVRSCSRCTLNADCGEVDTCISDAILCTICATAGVQKAAQQCMATVRTSLEGLCVSTAWLQFRGLSHAAIRHTGIADVLCIPGELPCGTRGHLLRECTVGGVCKLVSYGEVCHRRQDCVESRQPVSQLKHSFDWSSYQAESVSEDNTDATLSLTSLSVRPDSSLVDLSRLIAYAADELNKLGLGFVCDSGVSLQYKISSVYTLIGKTKS